MLKTRLVNLWNLCTSKSMHLLRLSSNPIRGAFWHLESVYETGCFIQPRIGKQDDRLWVSANGATVRDEFRDFIWVRITDEYEPKNEETRVSFCFRALFIAASSEVYEKFKLLLNNGYLINISTNSVQNRLLQLKSWTKWAVLIVSILRFSFLLIFREWFLELCTKFVSSFSLNLPFRFGFTSISNSVFISTVFFLCFFFILSLLRGVQLKGYSKYALNVEMGLNYILC